MNKREQEKFRQQQAEMLKQALQEEADAIATFLSINVNAAMAQGKSPTHFVINVCRKEAGEIVSRKTGLTMVTSFILPEKEIWVCEAGEVEALIRRRADLARKGG